MVLLITRIQQDKYGTIVLRMNIRVDNTLINLV